jgi:hypothetical protein
MGGFKDYLAGLKPIPKEKTEANWGRSGEAPPRGEVRNPLYHRNADKVWGYNEHDYLPPEKFTPDQIMAAHKAGKPISNWDHLPVQEIETKHLISPQRELDVSHLDSMPEHKQNEPISVVKTKTGQHIIIDGNHRAAIAHGTTGKIKAQIFQSKR